MKQIWPTYAYSPTTNVLTLTGLNIDRDQLLLVTAADRGRIMYNFADSSVTASAFTSGANTALTLVATTAGLTTTAALVIYFDDQATSSTVTGTVELGPTSLNALESITVTMGQVTVTGGLTDVQLRASAVTVGGTVTVGNFPASQAVTFGAVTGSVSVLNFPASQAVTFTDASLTNTQLRASAVTVGGTVTVGNSLTVSSLPAISGTVTANVFGKDYDGTAVALPILTHETNVATRGIPIGYNDNGNGAFSIVSDNSPLPVAPAAYDGDPISIQLGQDGDVASPSLVVPIGFAGDGEFKRVAFDAGLPISGTVTANTFAVQGTAVTTSNFTSTTASTVLASFNATREVLTIFNEGAGNLHICAGATCTTIAYQVRLSAGDYYEVPNHQTTITHSAVYATAGTARVTQVT